MSDKVQEIIRSYSRAVREGYEMHLTTQSIQFYLDVILDLQAENSKLRNLVSKEFEANPVPF